MPVASQQGSRAGLITAVVIVTILCMAFAGFVAYFYSENHRLDEELSQLNKKYADILAPSALNSDVVRRLDTARSAQGSRFSPRAYLLDVAVGQRDDLAKAITGQADQDTSAALSAVDAAVKKANSLLGAADVKLAAPPTLVGSIDALAAAVDGKQKMIDDLDKRIEDDQQKMAQEVKLRDDQLAEKDKQVAQAREEAQKAVADAAKDRADKQAAVAEIEKQRDAERKVAAEAVEKLTSQVEAKNRQITKLNQDVEARNVQLARRRYDPTESIVRQSDGEIVRVASNSIVYINRGLGDQISPGLTFEVYDKIIGVPPGETTNEDELPVGKGSIEVIHVGLDSSECRVIKTQPGTAIAEGDVIANLVYDPHQKYNFVVFGKFDLDQNGVFTSADADVLKRLITQWGGHVADRVNVDTDFVVMGKEPTLPSFTRDELQTPSNAHRLAEAQADLDAYNNIKQEARDLHIPVLNQNRFLYFTGYYDMAAR